MGCPAGSFPKKRKGESDEDYRKLLSRLSEAHREVFGKYQEEMAPWVIFGWAFVIVVVIIITVLGGMALCGV